MSLVVYFKACKLLIVLCVLGKLCLQDEDLAKTSLMFMTRDLEHSQHAAIRNNIVVVLCDLAVR